MDFVFSNHAEEQLFRRRLNRTIIMQIISYPEQIVVDKDNHDISIYQSIFEENGQRFLFRVFINMAKDPRVIVTLYRTTKIQKYYESKI